MKTILLFLILASSLTACHEVVDKNETTKINYKVGILGCPSAPDVEWNDKNMQLMKDLGFNSLQLNIAWGYRPGDEPLNLVDVLVLPKKYQLRRILILH